MNFLNYLRERAAYWVAKVADSIVGDDPDPQYSPLDNSDGLYDVELPEPPGSTMTNSEAFDLNVHLDDLAAPLTAEEEDIFAVAKAVGVFLSPEGVMLSAEAEAYLRGVA